MTQTDNEDGWWRFLALCAELKTAEELNDFFELFFTIEERKDMATRYLVVKDLLEGKKTQREMAETLKVSIAKITRGSNGLKTIGENLRNFLIKKIK
ncbi:MAG: trp operon repressor [Gammaproteobacteria bacterium]|nr:trp operon repressor [Gammaproteobacteria bacterium]